MASKHERYHVASSTEGWFVMTDTRIVAGPFVSEGLAQSSQDKLEDNDMLCYLLGVSQTWADELEKVKTRVLLPLATADGADLQAKFDFDTLDRIVCSMREATDLQQKRWEGRIHNR